jgi:hypothetical protein
MASRVRNLAFRSGTMASVGVVTFAIVFGLLLWFTRVEREALLRMPVPLDTLPLAKRAAELRALQQRADSVFAAQPAPQRVLLARSDPALFAPTPLAGDSTTARADSIAPPVPIPATPVVPGAAAVPATAIAALSERLQRAQNAPLASSWRALASDPLLQQDARVRALADSLAEAERERDEYDAVGGVDPIYLELSSRVTALGRAIERSAAARIMAAGSGALAAGVALRRAAPEVAVLARRYVSDSIRYDSLRLKRDQVAQIADTATRLLYAARAEAQRRDASRARAQRRVDALASPGAMLAASLATAVGVALLFGVLLEVRAPRLATDREVATQARVPVLLSIRDTDGRSADALTSAFSQLVFDLEAVFTSTQTILILSDDPRLASRTAARIAERLGYDGRHVRVVSPTLGAARITTRARPRATPSATQAVLVQPERNRGVAWTGEYTVATLPHHTTTLRAGTLDELRGHLAARDRDEAVVLLAVRIGGTPTAWLTTVRAALQGSAGSRALGVVVWAAEIEDNDPISFALDTALQRTLDVTTAPA